MFETIHKYIKKPALYTPSTAKFWDDDHISKGMLEAHLNPTLDSATRNLLFIKQSVQWIAKIATPYRYRALLDLGCGPGIYAELFDEAGFLVTGIDLSPRSIKYARSSAEAANKQIEYIVANYLRMDYIEKFDVITLIYCDFGVLSTENRAILLQKIHAALKPGGKFIFDVFTPYQYENQSEYKQWEYAQNGFWSAEPYLCLNSLYRYDAENTFLRQYLVISGDEVNCYNVWEHTFTKDEIIQDLSNAGFKTYAIYGDVTGSVYFPDNKQLCVLAERI